MRQIKENLALLPLLSITLILSVLAFLFKGVSYLVIGSNIPFLLGIIILILIILGFNQRNRLSRRIFRFWAWLLVFWGFTRLTMELMFVLTSITEEHIQNQFTIGQRVFSISAIFIGLYIIKKVRFYSKVSA